MIRRILSKLLHLANADPPTTGRREFYALKERILRRWGHLVGEDIQHIVYTCWTCNGCGIVEPPYTDGDFTKCWKCAGTGIYAEFWSRLERWELGGRIFHRPVGKLYHKPDMPVAIDGKIEHVNPGIAADEAFLWLCLLSVQANLFWRNTAHVWRYSWTWHPLVNLGRINWFLARTWERVRRRRCSCGKTFRLWFDGGGWLACRKCRQEPQEVPF